MSEGAASAVVNRGAAPLAPAPISVSPAIATPVSWRARIRARVAAYLALTKPRIVELLLVTTVPAMLLADPGAPLAAMLAVLTGGALAAGAANAINSYLDRDIDQLMRRTAGRPLPAHAISAAAALRFGLALAALSVAGMAIWTNWLATALTAAAILYYDLIYTKWLKRTTALSTFWGGVCGAAPVLIGWSAVTGTLGWPAVVMFAIVFFWQMPHFYALAIKCRDDYAAAGIPMLPVVASLRRVGRESVVYAWLAVAASLALWTAGLGPLYGAVALLAGGAFLVQAHRLDGRIRRGEPPQPMRLFHWSTSYLTIVFVAIAVDSLLRT